VLSETKRLLVAKHGFSDEAQQAYVDKILQRFANPFLPDTVDRVGRQPLRKLSRTERLIAPAAELAERGVRPGHLLATVEAATRFDVPDDPQSVELQQLLRTLPAAEATERITGLTPADPLYDDVVAVLARRVGVGS
jgi:mannitol-1-phosphate 5-dehydrogenase